MPKGTILKELKILSNFFRGSGADILRTNFFFFDYLELHFQSLKDKDETREVNYRKDL